MQGIITSAMLYYQHEGRKNITRSHKSLPRLRFTILPTQKVHLSSVVVKLSYLEPRRTALKSVTLVSLVRHQLACTVATCDVSSVLAEATEAPQLCGATSSSLARRATSSARPQFLVAHLVPQLPSLAACSSLLPAGSFFTRSPRHAPDSRLLSRIFLI